MIAISIATNRPFKASEKRRNQKPPRRDSHRSNRRVVQRPESTGSPQRGGPIRTIITKQHSNTHNNNNSNNKHTNKTTTTNNNNDNNDDNNNDNDSDNASNNNNGNSNDKNDNDSGASGAGGRARRVGAGGEEGVADAEGPF